MRRLFGKPSHTEVVQAKDEENDNGGDEIDNKEKEPERKHDLKPKRKPRKSEPAKAETGEPRPSENAGEGDAERGTLRRRRTAEQASEQESAPEPRRKHTVRTRDESARDSSESGPEEIRAHGERPDLGSKIPEGIDKDESVNVPSTSKRKSRNKDKKSAKKEEHQGRSQQHIEADLYPDSSTDYIGFANKKDFAHLTKVESGKTGHFLSSSYNYFSKPISALRVRAKLLKYPAFTDQDLWPGDMAVMDARDFGWQEKVFSKAEVKFYQKLENCKTEQEKKYHKEILENPDCIGKFLYTYVSDDPYVIKKRLRTLVRKCPVPHIRSRVKAVSKYPDMKSTFSDGELFDDDLHSDTDGFNSDETIDFDNPVSSSTPKTQRKLAKDASEAEKAEKRERARKEKESKNLEKRSKKLKETQEKKEKDQERRKQQEDTTMASKLKKIGDIQEKEKELKDDYMKKYNYSRRPSLPVGARMRSVHMSPSPKTKKHKVHIASKSSDPSQDDKESGQSMDTKIDSKGGKRRAGGGKHNGRRSSDGSLRMTKRVGHEFTIADSSSELDANKFSYYKESRPYRGMVRTRKSSSRLKHSKDIAFKNAKTMFIMASIPYLPHKWREIVVCMIQNIHGQRVLSFKPALGYRNVEAKRNFAFRISCELCTEDESQETGEAFRRHQKSAYVDSKSSIPPGIPNDFGNLFETAPSNELRLTVMGEITTAAGFDSSPISVYYLIDIPKGWRNDSILSNIEGITHACFTNEESVAYFSHEFSFQLAFSMDSMDESDSFPTPVIGLTVVSMNHTSHRVMHEGYGYFFVPMTPGSHYLNIRTWKPRPRSTLEKMRATFLDMTPSLHDMKYAYAPYSQDEDSRKANLAGFLTDASGSVKIRLHVIHQTPTVFKQHEGKLDLLEKMSSATILKSVQAVIEAFQRARRKAMNLKDQYE